MAPRPLPRTGARPVPPPPLRTPRPLPSFLFLSLCCLPEQPYPLPPPSPPPPHAPFPKYPGSPRGRAVPARGSGGIQTPQYYHHRLPRLAAARGRGQSKPSAHWPRRRARWCPPPPAEGGAGRGSREGGRGAAVRAGRRSREGRGPVEGGQVSRLPGARLRHGGRSPGRRRVGNGPGLARGGIGRTPPSARARLRSSSWEKHIVAAARYREIPDHKGQRNPEEDKIMERWGQLTLPKELGLEVLISRALPNEYPAC
ncbi:uncharacterized protein LOC108588860 [Callithrix jacchus]